METVTFTTTKTVNIADADGKAIHEGSVLQDIATGEIGVVMTIFRAGQKYYQFGPICVGDLEIRLGPGCTRITNRYAAFRHVADEKQTYELRYLSWLHTLGSDDYLSESLSAHEQKAITGILALLPPRAFNPNGDWPCSLEEALALFARHLDKPAERAN